MAIGLTDEYFDSIYSVLVYPGAYLARQTELQPGGVLCIYGPFRYNGRYTSGSNQDFDLMLQERDPNSGLRDIQDVTALSAQQGLHLRIDHDMPANNRMLEFIKD